MVSSWVKNNQIWGIYSQQRGFFADWDNLRKMSIHSDPRFAHKDAKRPDDVKPFGRIKNNHL